MLPKMVNLKLHDRLAGDRKPEMPWLDDAGMDRSNGNLEDPLAFDLSKRILPLGALQDRVPLEVFLEWVGALRPVLVTDEPAHIRVSDRDQAEHVADLTLVPFGRMDMRRDGPEQTIVPLQVRAEQQPVFLLRQREQIAEFVARLVRSMVNGPQERQGTPETRMSMEIMRDHRHILLVEPQP